MHPWQGKRCTRYEPDAYLMSMLSVISQDWVIFILLISLFLHRFWIKTEYKPVNCHFEVYVETLQWSGQMQSEELWKTQMPRNVYILSKLCLDSSCIPSSFSHAVSIKKFCANTSGFAQELGIYS
ncbi:hypothetical protein KIL84_021824 [Mauremys mutica]|uniref:Uncharacterized protein n=1 Tax=Mauremys mutica TaxID=74926 RepID=A0A9D3XGK5_9SAUR|nr:hypothetical protein KIL84_021824 [Mauremys mutica]